MKRTHFSTGTFTSYNGRTKHDTLCGSVSSLKKGTAYHDNVTCLDCRKILRARESNVNRIMETIAAEGTK